jgi:hypothetical protein
MYYIKLPLDCMNMSADALFGWPVVCKPMEFGNSFWNSDSTYVARSVFQNDNHNLLFKELIHFNITTFLLNVCTFTSWICLSIKIYCANETKIYTTNI